MRHAKGSGAVPIRRTTPSVRTEQLYGTAVMADASVTVALARVLVNGCPTLPFSAGETTDYQGYNAAWTLDMLVPGGSVCPLTNLTNRHLLGAHLVIESKPLLHKSIAEQFQDAVQFRLGFLVESRNVVKYPLPRSRLRRIL